MAPIPTNLAPKRAAQGDPQPDAAEKPSTEDLQAWDTIADDVTTTAQSQAMPVKYNGPPVVPSSRPGPQFAQVRPGVTGPATQPPLQALAQAPSGEIEYTAGPGDTLAGIAGRFGLSEDALKAANPGLNKSGSDPIPAGRKLTILNSDRAQIALQMAGTRDPDKLKQLVTADLSYATRDLATPDDRLKAAQDRLMARRPGDAIFAKIVQDQGEELKNAWAVQGRTHAVWDPLLEKVKQGDFEGLKGVVDAQIRTLTATQPTVEAVENYKKMLLAYRPNDAYFARAVNEDVQKYLVSDPQAAAGQVAAAYKNGGAQAASKLLRELTDPQKADPLAAALIAQEAKPTIDAVLSDFAALRQDHPASISILQRVNGIYADMSAVADSIGRSPEGKGSIDRMANAFASRGANIISFKDAVANGSGTVLSMAVAKAMLKNGDNADANRVAGEVLRGLEGLKETVRDNVDKLLDTEATVRNPFMNWEQFVKGVNGMQAPTMEQWLDQHPELVEQLKSGMGRINVSGYQLERAIAGVAEYAPDLGGLSNQAELARQSEAEYLNHKTKDDKDNPEWDRRLSFALAVSPAALQDGLREFNLDGLRKGALADLTKIVPDPSWPLRTVRNESQSINQALSGVRPFTIGLSLFGTGTYVWGVADHGTELYNKSKADGLKRALLEDNGWRNAGFLGMYVAGVGIESAQAYAQFAVNRFGWTPATPATPGWRGWVARAAIPPDAAHMERSGWLGRLFINHLRAFGVWNAIGTANYFARGERAKGVALLTATVGTGMSTLPNFPLWSWLPRVGIPVGLAGNTVTAIGAAAIYIINSVDKENIIKGIEALHEDYLKTAGLRPDIARALAKVDGDGVSGAQRLLALAAYRHVEPAKLLGWLNGQPAGAVERFVRDALLPLKADRDGNYAERTGRSDWYRRVTKPRGGGSFGDYYGEVSVTPAPDPHLISPDNPIFFKDDRAPKALSLQGVADLAELYFGLKLPGE
jgi:LysM domain